jgi:hypothetical protein
MEQRMLHFIQTTEEMRMFETFFSNITPKARKVFYYELKAMEQWLFEKMVELKLREPEPSTWEKFIQTLKCFIDFIRSKFALTNSYNKLANREKKKEKKKDTRKKHKKYK